MKIPTRKLMACLAGIVLAAACSRWRLHSRSAVERAIQAHLEQNSHLLVSNFTTQVESVSFKGDSAEALVKFQSKESANLSVEVKYGLRLEGDHWEVVSSAPMSGQGGDSHGSQEEGVAPAGSLPASPPLTPSH